jgi:hypothetical protein
MGLSIKGSLLMNKSSIIELRPTVINLRHDRIIVAPARLVDTVNNFQTARGYVDALKLKISDKG